MEAGVKNGMDLAQREKTVLEFASVLRHMAHRLSFRLPPALDVEDLIHAGVIGLMDAMDKYDSTRDVRFKTYAEFRMRGAMLDEIRSLNWIPRSVHEKNGLLCTARETLERRLGRAATGEEVAQEMNLTPEAFATLLNQAKAAVLLSLDDLGVQEGEEYSLIESIADTRAENPLLSLLSQGAREGLVAAIDRLPPRERQIITLYYHEDLTMKEIGLVLNVTESRVCQLHAQAISRLKQALSSVEAREAQKRMDICSQL
jgi:RNA polymerase sigma factor for flagellar operon FliA